MIFRNFTLRTLLFILIIPALGQSQVQDLSYTLSPVGEYILWGDQAGLEDGLALGGKLGFGFGQYVELSGTYLQALNLQTDFSDFGLPGYSESLFTARDVNWQRYGGELRLNLSKGALLPFLTLGSGIQRTELEVSQGTNTLNEQIFIDLGAGVVLSVADRYTLSLAVRNNQYRFNAVRDLMTSSDRDALGIVTDDHNTNKVVNWGLNASLQFYLGGRNPDKMTAVDKAYQRTFGSGLRGISVPIEPVAGKIKFHENLPYRNTWYAGGNIGINLGSYIGLRGFYWRAMENDKFQNFDDLSLYGGEAKFNLNSGQGLTPFISIGGGYLNVLDAYEPRTGTTASDQPFAMGGAGLTLPLSPYFKLFGGARAILLTQEDLDDLSQPGDVLTSWNYHFGVRLIIGQKAINPNNLIDQDVNSQLNEQQKNYRNAQNKLREEYENDISRLEQKMEAMNALNDSLERMQDQQIEEKDTVSVEETKVQQDTLKLPEKKVMRDSVIQSKSIRMSPEELGDLMKVITEYGIEIKRIDLEEERIRSRERAKSQSSGGRTTSANIDRMFRDTLLIDTGQDTIGNQSIQISRSELERLLRNKGGDTSILSDPHLEMSTNPRIIRGELSRDVDKAVTDEEVNEMKRQFENEISGYKVEISDYEKEIKKMEVDLDERENDLQNERRASDSLENALFEIDPEKRFETTDSTFTGRMYYKGLSGIGGIVFGNQTAITLGFRTNFGIRNTHFRLMTETYAGVGSESLVGLSIGGLYDIRIATEGALSRFMPYIGIGVGLQQPGNRDGLQGTYGLILGSELQLWEGKAFVDYTMRNIFDYNQIVLGYKFPF